LNAHLEEPYSFSSSLDAVSRRLEKVKKRFIVESRPKRDEEQRLSKLSEEIQQDVDKAVSDLLGPKAVKLELGGSYARGTWVSGEGDIDLFLKFPASVSKEEMGEDVKKIGLRVFRDKEVRLRYSEHPYVEAFVDSQRVNLVPCYDVHRGDWRSAADRSPFHTKYIIEALGGDESKKDEIRAFKKFVRLSGVYGAEVKVSGFSGYVCELLTLTFGSKFESVVSRCSSFKRGDLLPTAKDISQAHRDLLLSEEESRQSYLRIPDPVDPKRNLGRAISAESVCRLSMTSRLFLEEPLETYKLLASGEFGVGKGGNSIPASQPVAARGLLPINKEEESLLLENVVCIFFRHSERPVDVLWGQLRRTSQNLTRRLEIGGFKVLRKSVASDEKNDSGIFFLLQTLKLPQLRFRQGPEVERKEESLNFLKKNISLAKRRAQRTNGEGGRLFWIGEDSRLYFLKRELETNVVDFLRQEIRGPAPVVAPGLKEDFLKTVNVFASRKEILKLGKSILSKQPVGREKKEDEGGRTNWFWDGLAAVVKPNFPILERERK
jgi:tRNA nucleotidyltransferase (CCA-adding enzyme)